MIFKAFVNTWHNWLDMKKFDRAWHEQDLVDELAEYHEERRLLKKWSELSDVVYTCSRGRWGGYDIPFPFKAWQYYVGVVYMVPKYSGRWLFFRAAGKKAGGQQAMREVRNPKKTHKLHTIAEQHNLDAKKFQAICEAQLRYWPLLP